MIEAPLLGLVGLLSGFIAGCLVGAKAIHSSLGDEVRHGYVAYDGRIFRLTSVAADEDDALAAEEPQP